MTRKSFRVQRAGVFTPCPCGNATRFVAVSAQRAEDCCEIWIECAGCGHDPTRDRTGSRLEDVWGSLDGYAIQGAMECREDALTDPAGAP